MSSCKKKMSINGNMKSNKPYRITSSLDETSPVHVVQQKEEVGFSGGGGGYLCVAIYVMRKTQRSKIT